MTTIHPPDPISGGPATFGARHRQASGAPPATAAQPVGAGRLASLDAYRGFIMLCMVSAGFGFKEAFANHPAWAWLADQTDHRAWQGCTFWDLIQPSFIFMVGVAMPYAFARRRELGQGWGRQFLHVVRRSATLLIIGWLLVSWWVHPAAGAPQFEISYWTVLQQIAIAYFLAFLVLDRGPWVQAVAAALILFGYWLAFRWYPTPAAAGHWVKNQNLGTWVDLKLSALHLIIPAGKSPNPGGYLTINAIASAATVIFGILAGELLRSRRSAGVKMVVLLAAGLGGLALGAALSGWPVLPVGGWAEPTTPPAAVAPIIKRIWTSSFAVFAAGWTCLFLLAFYTVIDVLRFRRWAFPLIVVGMNSIAMYVAVQMFKPEVRKLIAIGTSVVVQVRDALDAHLGLAAKGLSPTAEPIVHSLLILGVFWLIMLWLYRRRLFFKV